MKIQEDFIKDNGRIEIISNKGTASSIPDDWGPILSSCDALVAIPDMHMYIYNSPLDNFKYGAEAMIHFLNYLDNLKEDMSDEGKTLRIYQIGDLYENRFPGLSTSRANATSIEIRMSNPKYDRIINYMDNIRTHYLYGNHDFEHRHYPGFRFAALEGSIYLEHGFTPDTWADFSNPNAPLWEESQLVFKSIREVNEFFANLLVNLGMIKHDENLSIGVESGKIPNYSPPDIKKYEEKYADKYIDFYSRRLMNDQNGLNAKICLIGHTHLPYLNMDINNGNYAFIDAGAWTEGRSDFAVITNEELAICCYHRD